MMATNKWAGMAFLCVFAVFLNLPRALAEDKPSPGPDRTIAVFAPGLCGGVGEEVAGAVSREIKEGVKASGSYAVVDDAKLKAITRGQQCSVAPFEEKCFAEQGRALGAEKLITGSISLFRGLYYFSFMAIDGTSGKVINMIEDTCPETHCQDLARGVGKSLGQSRFFFLDPAPAPDWRSPQAVTAFYRTVLDYPGKDAWQKPEEVADLLSLTAGEPVAEIGAGTGYFTRWLARKAGKGVVYAVDISETMLDAIRGRAASEGLANIRTVLARPEDPGLEHAAVAVVFLADIYVALPDRPEYLKRLHRLLKPGGRVAIVDFDQPPGIPYVPLTAIEFGQTGLDPLRNEDAGAIAALLTINRYKTSRTPAGAPFRFRIPREQVIREMERAGFVLKETYSTLPYEYYLVFSEEVIR